MGGSGIPVIDPITAQIGLGRNSSSTIENLTGGSKGPQSPDSVNSLAQIATQLFQETSPLRGELIGQSMDFVGGGLDVTGTPQYGALKQATEQQFDVARQRALGGIPTGGSLSQALTDVEMGRAGALTQGIGTIANQQQQQALGLATGQTGQAISGLSSAGGIQAQQAQAQAAQNAAAKQGLGQVAGMASIGAKASDIRLKKNLKFIAQLKNGVKIWSWEWNEKAKELGISGLTAGVIAQEIIKIIPSAISTHKDGYLMVDYDQVSNHG